MQIPLYQRNVAQTSETGTAPVSAEAMMAPSQAIARVGAIASEVGFEFAEKLRKEETDSQVATYAADRERRKEAMQSTLSSLSSQEEIEAGYQKWLEEEDRIFAESDLNKDARRMVGNNNEGFYADTTINAGRMARNAKIQEMDRGWIEVQNMALSPKGGVWVDPETGEALEGTALYQYATERRMSLGTIDFGEGQNLMTRVPSKMAYNAINLEIEEIKGLHLDGTLNEEQYLEELNGALERVENNPDLSAEHSPVLQRTIAARINNIKGKRVSRATKTTDDIFKKLSENDLEGEDLAQLYQANPYMAGALDVSLKAQIKKGAAAGDEDAVAANDILKELTEGDESPIDALKRVEDLNSSYGVAATFVINSYLKEVAKGQDVVNAYENFFTKDQPVSVDGNTKTFMEYYSHFFQRKSDGHGDYMNEKFKALAKWQENPEDVTFEEFLDNTFGKDAVDEAHSIIAPQLTPSLPSVSTQEEFDALPSGAEFIEDGKKYRKP